MKIEKEMFDKVLAESVAAVSAFSAEYEAFNAAMEKAANPELSQRVEAGEFSKELLAKISLHCLLTHKLESELIATTKRVIDTDAFKEETKQMIEKWEAMHDDNPDKAIYFAMRTAACMGGKSFLDFVHNTLLNKEIYKILKGVVNRESITVNAVADMVGSKLAD